MARDDRRSSRSNLGVVDDDLMERYRADSMAAKKRSGSGSKADWISLKDGLNLDRVLPPLERGDPFYLFIGQHKNLGPEKKSFLYCPRMCLSMDGKTRLIDQACPVCEYVELVKSKSKQAKELAAAKAVQAKSAWLCQALDRDIDDNKPRIWSMGSMIYNQVMEYLTGKYPDLYQLEGGYDLNVKRSGKELETTYQVYPEKDPTDVEESVVDHMIDLEEYVRFRIFSEKDMERVLDGEDPWDIVNEREDGEAKAAEKGASRVERPRRREDEDNERDSDRPRGRDRDRDGDDRDRDRAEPRARDGRRPDPDDERPNRDRGERVDAGGREAPSRDGRAGREEPSRSREREDTQRSPRDDREERDAPPRGRGRADKYDDEAAEQIDRLRSEARGRR